MACVVISNIARLVKSVLLNFKRILWLIVLYKAVNFTACNAQKIDCIQGDSWQLKRTADVKITVSGLNLDFQLTNDF